MFFFSSGGGFDWGKRKALGLWRNWREKKMFDSWLTNGDFPSVTWSSSLTWNAPCNWRTYLPIRQGGGSVSRDTESGNVILSRNLLQKLMVILFLLQMHTSTAFPLPRFSLASCRFLKRIKSQNNFNWKYIPIKGRRKYILMVPKWHPKWDVSIWLQA